MKKIIMPVFAIVLLLHVNKTFAQTSQPPAGLNLHSSGTAMAEPQNTKTTTTAQAVNPQRETEVATRMSKTLESQLSLTTDQYLKVYEATLNYVKEMDAHKSGTPLTKEAHDQYVAEKNTKIKNVLTTAQYNNYMNMSKANGSVARNN